MIVSTKVWESLNEEEQQWLQEAADESAVYEYKVWAESTEESLSEMKKAGVTITYPDKEPFREAVESMYSDLQVQQPEIYKIVEQIRAVK